MKTSVEQVHFALSNLPEHHYRRLDAIWEKNRYYEGEQIIITDDPGTIAMPPDCPLLEGVNFISEITGIDIPDILEFLLWSYENKRQRGIEMLN